MTMVWYLFLLASLYLAGMNHDLGNWPWFWVDIGLAIYSLLQLIREVFEL